MKILTMLCSERSAGYSAAIPAAAQTKTLWPLLSREPSLPLAPEEFAYSRGARA